MYGQDSVIVRRSFDADGIIVEDMTTLLVGNYRTYNESTDLWSRRLTIQTIAEEGATNIYI